MLTRTNRRLRKVRCARYLAYESDAIPPYQEHENMIKKIVGLMQRSLLTEREVWTSTVKEMNGGVYFTGSCVACVWRVLRFCGCSIGPTCQRIQQHGWVGEAPQSSTLQG